MLKNILGVTIDSRAINEGPILRGGNSNFDMLPEQLFMKLFCLERRRTERSGRSFVLLLLDPGNLLNSANARMMTTLVSAISQSIRETDLMGWYKEGAIMGVIYTEVGDAEEIVPTLATRLTDSLHNALSSLQMNEVKVSFHIFPKDWGASDSEDPVISTLQMASASAINGRKVSLTVKRLIDIAGSLVALILCLPVLITIAVAIKLTSRGPVLFRQVRLGYLEKKFTFLKFRSMYVNNDQRIHEEYVARFIVGASDTEQTNGSRQKVYKLTADPRITPLGRFLRYTSLDEIPQFLNVLLGDMSLVGPRPPVTYEFDRYDLWHKQRLLAVKPGITGMWQVDGRSRVKFDDMVRLDIRYARSWSLWLDVKILLKTPRAVISGAGAC